MGVGGRGKGGQVRMVMVGGGGDHKKSRKT